MADVFIPRTLVGWARILEEGILTDLTVCLPDHQEMRVHRIQLASASDVLKAKFTTQCSDAVQDSWSPDTGTAAAWKWIIRWIYGCEEPLLWDYFLEILVIADQFQVTELVQALKTLDIESRAELLAAQLLNTDTCPAVLEETVMALMQVLSHGKILELLGQLQTASLNVVALFVKHLPLGAASEGFEGSSLEEMEEERLHILGSVLRTKGSQEAFPDCFVDAVRWEVFPARVLEAGFTGDFQHFERALGAPVSSSGKLGPAMMQAFRARCLDLESHCRHLKASFVPGKWANPGLFAKIVAKKQLHVQVSRSSVGGGPNTDGHELFHLEKKEFVTGRQQQDPWIEMRSDDVLVHVQAVGLQHGYNDGHHCKSFAIEAALDDGPWTGLMSMQNTPLTDNNQLFHVDEARCREDGCPVHFNRFRVRMTDHNTAGDWYLCVSWFDVFGSMRFRGLRDAVSKLGNADLP